MKNIASVAKDLWAVMGSERSPVRPVVEGVNYAIESIQEAIYRNRVWDLVGSKEGIFPHTVVGQVDTLYNPGEGTQVPVIGVSFPEVPTGNGYSARGDIHTLLKNLPASQDSDQRPGSIHCSYPPQSDRFTPTKPGDVAILADEFFVYASRNNAPPRMAIVRDVTPGRVMDKRYH